MPAAVRAAIDIVVWRIPTAAALRRMTDLEVERLFMARVHRDRPCKVLSREVDCRAAVVRAREQRQAAARARRRLAREDYDLMVESQFLAAERDPEVNGFMLNRAGVASGIDPKTLFSGSHARARKWASEDLLRWWDINCRDYPRMSYAAWKAQKRPPDPEPAVT